MYLKAQLVRGVSLPISDFFREVLIHYQVQPQNLSPNSILALSNYAALCEGYLGIRPRLNMFIYFFNVKREAGVSKDELRNCGTISFKIRPGRRFPDIVGMSPAKIGRGRTSMAQTFLCLAKKKHTRTLSMGPPLKPRHGDPKPSFPPTTKPLML